MAGQEQLAALRLDAPAASVCPTNASAAARYQQQATKVVGYLSSAAPGNVCGLQAGLISVACNAKESVELADATACGAELDTCFGAGVSGFLVPISHKTNDYVFELDPEPARLTAPHSGSNGATAAAYYINSGQNTTVVKYGGQW